MKKGAANEPSVLLMSRHPIHQVIRLETPKIFIYFELLYASNSQIFTVKTDPVISTAPHRAPLQRVRALKLWARTDLVKVNTISPYTTYLSPLRVPPQKFPTTALR